MSMGVRYLVQDEFQIPGRGPMVAGLLTHGDLRRGDSLVVEATGSTVRITSVEVHAKETPQGLFIGVGLHPEDAPKVTVGSTLVSPPAA